MTHFDTQIPIPPYVLLDEVYNMGTDNYKRDYPRYGSGMDQPIHALVFQEKCPNSVPFLCGLDIFERMLKERRAIRSTKPHLCNKVEMHGSTIPLNCDFITHFELRFDDHTITSTEVVIRIGDCIVKNTIPVVNGRAEYTPFFGGFNVCAVGGFDRRLLTTASKVFLYGTCIPSPVYGHFYVTSFRFYGINEVLETNGDFFQPKIVMKKYGEGGIKRKAGEEIDDSSTDAQKKLKE